MRRRKKIIAINEEIQQYISSQIYIDCDLYDLLKALDWVIHTGKDPRRAT